MNDQPMEPDWPVLKEEGTWTGKNLMSNFDHQVDDVVAQQLRDEQVMAVYPGWDFNALCWFADDRFHAAVYRYHVRRAIISASTPKKLMKAVCKAFGRD